MKADYLFMRSHLSVCEVFFFSHRMRLIVFTEKMLELSKERMIRMEV